MKLLKHELLAKIDSYESLQLHVQSIHPSIHPMSKFSWKNVVNLVTNNYLRK